MGEEQRAIVLQYRGQTIQVREQSETRCLLVYDRYKEERSLPFEEAIEATIEYLLEVKSDE